jgi:Cu(I)/Ag(I) efflux system membrane fusion protein/cobalt-zinc-cadmium efflux system membrane fusion protein
MEMKNDTTKIENIVREGVIDLKKIDKNKDGKVFQDPMDWNVISDKAGKCPLCKMTLKEVTIKKAKENLKKHGFKVKQ